VFPINLWGVDNMKKIYKNILIVIAIIAVIYTITRVAVLMDLIKLLAISFVIAYALKPIHKKIVSKGLNKNISAIIIIVGALTMFLATFTILIPGIIKESLTISNSLMELRGITDKIYENMRFIGNNKWIEGVLNNIYEKINNITLGFFDKLFERILGFGEHLLSLAVIPVIVYYLLSEREKIWKKFLLLIPVQSRNVVKNICSDIDKILSRYIVSQFFLCILIGCLTFFILLLLKIDYPLLLSILNALFNIIPYFGPFFGSVPILLIALLNSPKAALWAAVCLYAIQQIEGDIISPKITGESVSIHPLVVILLLIMGGKLGGFFGMVMAVPVGVIVKVIYEDLNYYLF
jgi:predicted PurR-regulated permease PerM